MPELPIEISLDRKGGDLAVHEGLRTLSIMLYPDDGYMRNCYYCTNLARQIEKYKIIDLINLDLFSDVLSCPSLLDMEIKSLKAYKRCSQVGSVLYLIRAMDEICPNDEPSLRKAIYFEIDVNKYAKGVMELDFVTTEQSLWNYWKSFSSVSHLWAANRYIDIERKTLYRDLKLDEYKRFLAYAELFRKYGESRTSSRNNEPLLKKETVYKVPAEVELPHIEFHFAEPDTKEMLEGYFAILLEKYPKRDFY